jgi:serine protease Do
MAKDLLPQLKTGKVIRGWLGVMIQPITPELKEKLKLEDEEGALVADVTEGGPADKGGIIRGDVIVGFDGKQVNESKDFPFFVASTRVGKSVKVEVIRKGQRKTLEVKIGELKEEKEPQAVSEMRPRLGMTVEELTPELKNKLGLSETSGVVVIQVDDNTPAAEAGVRPGDIILEVDQARVENLDQFKQKMGTYKGGDTILFLIKREEATLYLTVKLWK